MDYNLLSKPSAVNSKHRIAPIFMQNSCKCDHFLLTMKISEGTVLIVQLWKSHKKTQHLCRWDILEYNDREDTTAVVTVADAALN